MELGYDGDGVVEWKNGAGVELKNAGAGEDMIG